MEHHVESAGGSDVWPTVDGPLGIQPEAALRLARLYFIGGFFLLPWLWFANCFYFWPILRSRRAQPQEARKYILYSAVGFVIFSGLLLTWSLSYSIGGERVFGTLWKRLSVYELADSML